MKNSELEDLFFLSLKDSDEEAERLKNISTVWRDLLPFLCPKEEAVCFPETSIIIYQATRRYIPEDGNFPSHRCEKSQISYPAVVNNQSPDTSNQPDHCQEAYISRMRRV